METLFKITRKPNSKKWVCPIDGKIINSRGAPAYLRNRYHVPWNKEYLINPSLLCKKNDSLRRDELYIKIRGLFSTLDEKNEELVGNISVRLFSITSRIRTAIENNSISQLEEIYYRLITASRYKIVKPKKYKL